MPKMSPAELTAMLGAEKADALAATKADKLSKARADAMDYYMGDVSSDMPTPDGRSKAVSTDVADTIEGLMPPLMEIFAASDEVVRFEPVGAEDVKAAEQETDYVNHVFMQKNPGFLVLYSFIKDALLSKVGIVKVWWEKKEQEERETYYDLDEAQFTLIVSDPEVEVIEHSVRTSPLPAYPDPSGLPAQLSASPDAAAAQAPTTTGPVAEMAAMEQAPPGMPPSGVPMFSGPPPEITLHDVTVQTKKTYECAKVEGVPPEEFGIARNARCIRDADYCFHEVLKSEDALIQQGYDKAQIKKLPTYTNLETNESISRDTVGENEGGEGDELNKARRLIKVTEHYVRMDYERNGKVCLYRVTTGGDAGEILKRDGQLDVVKEDLIPFAAMTPVIVTHRFFGRSIADLVMDIQRIKTALLRAVLDNAYLANNPRVEVAESYAGPDTLDDLLVSRPGGIVRTKQPGGIQWQQVPTIGNHVFPLLEYQDATREWRTGVSRAGQGLDANALQNQSATAANQLFNAAQARMKLIARIFAETGIRDLFALLHSVIRKNGTREETVRLRNEWVNVDPREWKSRNDMTINVGLGNGGKSEQLAQMQFIIAAQEKAIAAGLVSPKNLFASAKQLVRLTGHKDVDEFFTPPGKQPDPNDPASKPIEPPPDPKLIELQAKNEIEKTQAQADIATNQEKVKADAALAERKFQHDAQLEQMRFELERELKLIEAQLKQNEWDAKAQDRQAEGQQKERDAQVKIALEGLKARKSEDGNEEIVSAEDDRNERTAAAMMELAKSLQQLATPKRARKMPDGSWMTELQQ